MAQPTTYSRAFNFTNFQASTPFDPLPGDQLDTELNRLKQTTDEILINLDLIQRDDGEIENRIIGTDQLKSEVLTQFGLLTPTRVKEFVYDIPVAVNEVQEFTPQLPDFDDAIIGGGGTGIGFDIEFDFGGSPFKLLEAARQTTTVAALEAAIEGAIAALTGNISITNRSGNPTSVIPWGDTSNPRETLQIEFIGALANTNVAQITLTFFEPGTAIVIAEVPIVASTLQVGAGAQKILTGADRNGDVLDYVVGAQISLHVNGVKTDPANIAQPNGATIIFAPGFSTSDVVTLEIGEAEFVATVDIEKLDDISPLFDGVTVAFPMSVGAQPRVVNNAARITLMLNDVQQEPGVDYTVSGSTLTFTTAPVSGVAFWAVTRTMVAIENGGIITQFLADGAVTGVKIADNTITEDKLAFNISQIPVAGYIGWIDDILPVNAPAGTLVFPVGQTCGKCGSGADIEDDDIEKFFDISKKRWGNIGNEDFDNLDVVLLPDFRGTVAVVPDKGVGKVATDNVVGNQSGLEFLPTRSLTGTATTSGSTDAHTLTNAELPEFLTPFHQAAGSGFNVITGGDSSSTINGTVNTTGGQDQGHDHVVNNLPLNHTNLFTNTDRIMQPYTVTEKILRIK